LRPAHLDLVRWKNQEREHNFGIVTHDLNLKPWYAALQHTREHP